MEQKYLEYTDRWGKETRLLICKAFQGEVWNIGRENFPFEGYIPLCHCDHNYHVVGEPMCVKVESEELALAAMHAAHFAKKADCVWFKDFRNRFYMDFEQRCRWLVGKNVNYVTINKADRLAKTETKGVVGFMRFDSICNKDAHFYVNHNNATIRMRFTEDFIRKLVLDGAAWENFCDGYYRCYTIKF